MSKHYIVMNGSVGCLPDNCDVCWTKRDAVDYLAQLFELSPAEQKDLRRDGILYFEEPAERGADYCEISECNCPSPEEHSDSM